MTMTVFLQGNKPTVKWDPKENKPLFQFCRRRLETDDPALIEILIEAGYGKVEDIQEEEEEEEELEVEKTLDGNIKGAATMGEKKKRVRLSRELKTQKE